MYVIEIAFRKASVFITEWGFVTIQICVVWLRLLTLYESVIIQETVTDSFEQKFQNIEDIRDRSTTEIWIKLSLHFFMKRSNLSIGVFKQRVSN